MAKYVDGFVIVVSKKKIAQYRKLAAFGRKLWLKYGALDYKECVGDDLYPPGMNGKKQPSNFIKMTRLKSSETLWFSFIVYKSRKHRDLVNAKVMADPQMQDPKMMESMPFEMNRFAYGGFKVMVDA